jgi:hypothetical protein
LLPADEARAMGDVGGERKTEAGSAIDSIEDPLLGGCSSSSECDCDGAGLPVLEMPRSEELDIGRG